MASFDTAPGPSRDHEQPEFGMRGYRIVDPERSAERRAEILAAGAKVFAEQGYDRATIADIAREMGVSKGVVYYQFRSKEEVFLAITTEAHLEARRRVEQVNAGGGTPADRLRAALHALISFTLDETTKNRSFTLVTGTLAMLAERNRQEVVRLRREGQRLFTTVIEAGQRDGSFVAGESHVLAMTVVTAALGVSRWFRPGRAATAEQVADQVSDQLLRSVLASPCGEETHG
jgi:AcrR family transcriptional regulator